VNDRNFVKMCNKVQNSDPNIGAKSMAPSGAPIIISIRKKTNSGKSGSVPDSQKVITFQDKNKNNCHIPMPASVIARSQKKARAPVHKKKDSAEKCSSVPQSESSHPKAIAIPEKENSGKCNVPQSESAHPKVIAPIPDKNKTHTTMTTSVIACSQKQNTLSIPKNINSGEDSVRKLIAQQKILTKLQKKKRLNSQKKEKFHREMQ